ncbi:MAG: HEAT repeat domain-containing protein [Armatimonadota bacterium]|nr:HEAT repeat domain-containing protein [Armatimonadota bacterium]
MRRILAGAVTLVTVIVITAAVCGAQDAAARRMHLVRGEPSVEALAEALRDPDVVVARTAARLLPSRGEEAVPAVGRALRHRDMLVRRSAAMNLGALGAAGLELVERALHDDHELVRQAALFALIELPHSAEAAALIERAGEDDSPLVQRTAIMATRAAYRTAESIQLPAEGWRIRKDPDDVGREQEWFAEAHDDSGWDEIAIEQFWGDAHEDYAEYTGVAWYRTTLELPDREPPVRAQLDFQSVDESAWVWVNGQYAGEHDLGKAGWNKPFRIDVTGMLNWGGENQLTVRVLNQAMAGGIYKPVRVVMLEPAQ